ncbi:MAG: inositol monophosphatase family protein [Candidatus Nanoarchaeia archaeon]
MELKQKTTDLKELEQTIIEACYSVGTRLAKYSFGIADIQWKKLDDPVTNLDREAEQEIINAISGKFHANFVGEEYGTNNNKSDLTIYIDPIDGTKSFVKGEFLSSVSVAAEYQGKLVFGAVYDFMRNILYYANDTGAYMTRDSWSSEKAISLPRKTPEFSKLAVIHTDNEKYSALLENASRRTQTGSFALLMAQVAAGVHQGLIAKPYNKGSQNNTCDIAAGYFIMKQAGMKIKDYDFREYDYKKPGNGILGGTSEFMSELKSVSKNYQEAVENPKVF